VEGSAVICERCAEKAAPDPRPRFNERARRRAKVRSVWDGRTEESFLWLRGGWLERLGFVPGQELEIEEGVGWLVIRAV
jgi:Toxin SymE, type I toxin-antitoxin system